MEPRDLLLRMFAAAVDAAAVMAQAVEAHWPADRPLSGLVVTQYGHSVGPLPRIEVVEASHPVPDAAGQAAAGRMQGLRMRFLSPAGPCRMMTRPRDCGGAGHVDREAGTVFCCG